MRTLLLTRNFLPTKKQHSNRQLLSVRETKRPSRSRKLLQEHLLSRGRKQGRLLMPRHLLIRELREMLFLLPSRLRMKRSPKRRLRPICSLQFKKLTNSRSKPQKRIFYSQRYLLNQQQSSQLLPQFQFQLLLSQSRTRPKHNQLQKSKLSQSRLSYLSTHQLSSTTVPLLLQSRKLWSKLPQRHQPKLKSRSQHQLYRHQCQSQQHQ